MDEDARRKITKELNALAARVTKAPAGKDAEQVNIGLGLNLTGQDAVNYLVIRIFLRELTDQQIINILFKVGLNYSIEVIKFAALTEYGIKL